MDAYVYERGKSRTLLAMLCVSVLGGILWVFTDTQSGEKGLYLVETLALSLLILRWCYLDGLQRDYRFGLVLGLTIVGLAVIGVPIYFLRSRGLRGFVALSVAFLVFLGLCFLNYAATQLTNLIFYGAFG